jgi:hypothetical protein
MFGALQFGGGYFAQGPPGVAVLEPTIRLDLCNADSYTLMPDRQSETLMGVRESNTLMPFRDSQRHCEDES